MSSEAPSGVVIRTAAAADVEAIGSLIVDELGYAGMDSAKWPDRFARILADGYHQTFVACIGGGVVGFIGMHRCIAYELDEDYLRVVALAVSSAYQRNGIGKELLHCAEQYAMTNGIRHISLSSGTSREKAHAFYERNGYEKRQWGFVKLIR